MTKTLGFAAKHSFNDLKPYEFERRAPKANDVQLDIMFCGVCHSDVHQVKNEWKNTVYPCMPGHEIVGRVTKVGKSVKRHKIGDIVGVGCMIDSCHRCEACKEGLENYCETGFLATYNGNQRHPNDHNHTFGGYSESMVVREDFVLKIPKGLDPAAAAPILCAGVTTYSPMRHWDVQKGTRLGIVGLGGLGHMAVKIAKALGAEITVVTTSADKVADAKKLGAKHVIVSSDEKAMKAGARSLDFILTTIPQPHDINPYVSLLKRDGTITVVGCIAPLTKPLDLSVMVPDRKSLGTSLIGSLAETQEVINFCAKHKVQPDIRIIDIEFINEAFSEIDKGDIDFRYVIDMASLRTKKSLEASRTLMDKITDLA